MGGVTVWQSHTVADNWWYCLTHKTVEPNDGCPNKNRLGPYPDEATAGRALEIVRERNEQWDAEDQEWEQGTPG